MPVLQTLPFLIHDHQVLWFPQLVVAVAMQGNWSVCTSLLRCRTRESDNVVCMPTTRPLSGVGIGAAAQQPHFRLAGKPLKLRSRFELWWNFGRPTRSLACKKNIFHMHAIKKIKKVTYVEIQNDFQNMLKFYDSLYGLWVKGLYWCSLWEHLP